MTTLVYGCSDDLVELDGDVCGEVGSGADDVPGLLVLSDGTLLSIIYDQDGIWRIKLVVKGKLFERIDVCASEAEDDDAYSDLAHFKDGLKWAYFARAWEKVK